MYFQDRLDSLALTHGKGIETSCHEGNNQLKILLFIIAQKKS